MITRRACLVMCLALDMEQYLGHPKKQPIMNLSSIEVDYVVATKKGCETIWMRRILI